MGRKQRDVAFIAFATILNVVPYAMLAPQAVVRLSEAGSSATALALYGLTPFAVILLMSPILPRVLTQLGLQTAHRISIFGATVALVGTSVLIVSGRRRSSAAISASGRGPGRISVSSRLSPWSLTSPLRHGVLVRGARRRCGRCAPLADGRLGGARRRRRAGRR